MERVTTKRAKALKSTLLEWRTPTATKEILREMAEPHGFYAAGQGNMQFWREAWCGSEFASLQNADAVRLSHSDPPDFEIRANGIVYRWELAEIRNPMSRTGAEFDKAAQLHNEGGVPPTETFDLDAHRKWLTERLLTTIERKAKKGYSPDIGLALYIHEIWVFPDNMAEIENTIAAAVTPHISKFRSISALVSNRLLSF